MNESSQELIRHHLYMASIYLVEANTALERLKPSLEQQSVDTNRLEKLLLEAGKALGEFKRLLDSPCPA